jgi:hypothetical protein
LFESIVRKRFAESIDWPHFPDPPALAARDAGSG